MKRELVAHAIMLQLRRLSILELEKEIGIDLEGRDEHVAEMLIHYESEDRASEMSEEEMNEFLLNLK